MAVLTASLEEDVPIQCADEEWSEFVWRSLHGSYANGFEDVATSLSETDADSGAVNFETEGDRLVNVSVELEYTAHGGGDRKGEVARAQTRLEHDLETSRVFLPRRCEQESCRTNERRPSGWVDARSQASRPRSIPNSIESTRASQLASMMFSLTPMLPQLSSPSLASRSTRVTAPVPLVSSRMRTL